MALPSNGVSASPFVPERKALIRNFVKGIEVNGDEAVLTYTIPMPNDGVTSESASVLDFVQSGPPTRTANSTGPPRGASAASRPVGARTPRTGGVASGYVDLLGAGLWFPDRSGSAYHWLECSECSWSGIL